MSRMKAKKRRIMTRKNWKKRWRQASKMKVEERAGYVRKSDQVKLEPPAAYRKPLDDASNF